MARADNRKNLKSNAERTPEQLKEMGAKGGRASAKARNARQLARLVLSLEPKLTAKGSKTIEKMGYDAEAEGAPTVELMGMLAIAKQYMAGDQAAGKYLHDCAHIAGLSAQMEKDRTKAAITAKQPAVTRDDPLVELLSRIDAEAAEGAAP